MMNYETIPHPEIPGANLVRFADGQTMAVPASAMSAMPPGATAQNVPQSFQDVAAKYAPEAPPQVAQDFPKAPPAPTPAQGGATGNWVEAPPLPQEAGGFARRQQEPVTYGDQLESDLRSPYKYVSGRAGYGPKEAEGRFAIKQGQATQQQGVKDFNPDAVRQYQQVQFEAAREKAAAEQLKYSNDLRGQELQSAGLDEIYQQKKTEIAAQERDFNLRMTDLEKQAKDVANTRIDPTRIVNDMSTWKKLTLVLASGVAGATNGSRGPNNPVMGMLQGMIAQDVKAQETAILMNKGNVDNALNRLSQQWGSLQAGKAALTALQIETMKQRIQATVGGMNSEAARMNAEGMLKELQAAQMKDLEDLRVFSAGQTNKQLTEAYMDPIKATAGGMTRKSLKERAADTKAADEIGGRRVEQDAKTLDNVAKRIKIQGSMSGTQLSSIDTRKLGTLGQQMADMAAVDEHIATVMSEAGIVDKNGRAEVPAGGIPGLGLGYDLLDKATGMPSLTNRVAEMAEGKKAGIIRREALGNLITKIKEASGAAFTDKELRNHESTLAMGLAAGPEAFAQALVNFKRAVQRKREAFMAGAGPQVADAYRRNVEYEQKRARGDQTQILGPYNGLDDAQAAPSEGGSDWGNE